MKQPLPFLLLLTAANMAFAQEATIADKGFSLAVRGGWSYRTAKIYSDLPSEAREHLKGLRSGYHIGGDAVYYFSEYFGVGVNYTMARFQNTSYETIKDDIMINYVGPAVHGRYAFANQKLHFIYGISLGYLHYKDDAFYEQSLTYTGQTFGIATNLGIHLSVNDHFLIGIEPSLISGTLNKVEISSGRQTETV